MWLLTTDRAELVLFRDRPPKEYAILSHVWRQKEQSFLAVRGIIRGCARTNRNPRDFVDDKIRKCCQWAEAHGFKLVWIDTCCIDKSSSAELSEAINSMFNWYAQATVCYAYLHDTADDENPSYPGSSFRRSEWFTRGWTLQELIAPRDVVFLSREWKPLASKVTAATLLEQITGIDAAILRGHRSLDDISVARRMSWAANRKTTRVEDEAYCLMGIFGVNLPTIYGEGREAFVRLQEEILRRTPDRTLLAWGPRHDLVEVVVGYRSSVYPTALGETYIKESCLLARSPRAFSSAASINSVPEEALSAAFGISAERTTVKVSSYGAQLRLPLVGFANHCTLALLPCRQDGAYVALVLRFQGTNGPWGIGTRVMVSQPLRTRVEQAGAGVSVRRTEHPVRCVLVGDLQDLDACLQHPLREREREMMRQPTWTRTFIAYRPQHVMVRSQDAPSERWSRQSFAAPCKLIIQTWTIRRLEGWGYTWLNPLASTFLELRPGETLSLIFQARGALAADAWPSFAVHIGANAKVRDTSTLRSSLWCAVHFTPFPPQQARYQTGVRRGSSSAPFSRDLNRPLEDPLRVAQAGVEEWVRQELMSARPRMASDPEGGSQGPWLQQWDRTFVDTWTKARRQFEDPVSGMAVQLRFKRLCDLPRQDGDARWRIQEFNMVDINLPILRSREEDVHSLWDDASPYHVPDVFSPTDHRALWRGMQREP
ncbi:heterokaryon incompatibility protein-domain-containing protein [Trametes elegans]|nr:heterokaryon incompatibility protein-domain-containing protein [Trametes elegans]